jgi:transglutaminase-like putative cysteine protease
MSHVAAPPAERDEWLQTGPAEGWLALAALLLAMLTLGTAVDDALWAGYAPGGSISQTSFLAGAGMLAVLVGLILAKSRLRVLTAYAIGVAIGVLVLLNSIASLIAPAPDFFAQLAGLNAALARWLRDVVLLGVRSSETVVFLLLMGALVWAAGLYAALGVFRRHRPIAAVVPAALILLINVTLTVRDELPHLVVFCTAVLLLVVRLNLFEHLRAWRSQGMADVSEVGFAFMRGSAVFLALVLAASATLAVSASSAPLSGAWRNADSQLLELGYDINRLLGGVSGEARGPNVLFAPTQTVRDTWESSGATVFSARSSDGVAHYWRGMAYVDFDGHTWQLRLRDTYSSTVTPGSDLLSGSADELLDPADRAPITVTLTPYDYRDVVFVAPDAPTSIDQPAEVFTDGQDGPFVYGRLPGGIRAGVPFTISALVRDTPAAAGLTANELAADGRVYPAWARPYVEIREGALSEQGFDLARQLVGSLPADQRDPYHVAMAIQEYLRSGGGFRYRTDLRGVCRGENVVDCFMRTKVGFCQQFATTMVMLLRAAQIPSRYVTGYLPGQPQADGSYVVGGDAAHAWVEVLFPSYGWVRFDPTPGNASNGQSPTTLPPGPTVTPPPQDPVTGGGGAPEFGESRLPPDERQGAGNAPAPGGPAASLPWLPLAIIAGLLLGLLAIAGLLRRTPTSQPEVAYRSLAGLAGRLGHGPQPAQTAYEFADGLALLMPTVRPELRLIATAKVEASYSRRPPAATLLASLAAAYRKARFGLLRLILRGHGRALLPRAPRVTDVLRRR